MSDYEFGQRQQEIDRIQDYDPNKASSMQWQLDNDRLDAGARRQMDQARMDADKAGTSSPRMGVSFPGAGAPFPRANPLPRSGEHPARVAALEIAAGLGRRCRGPVLHRLGERVYLRRRTRQDILPRGRNRVHHVPDFPTVHGRLWPPVRRRLFRDHPRRVVAGEPHDFRPSARHLGAYPRRPSVVLHRSGPALGRHHPRHKA